MRALLILAVAFVLVDGCYSGNGPNYPEPAPLPEQGQGGGDGCARACQRMIALHCQGYDASCAQSCRNGEARGFNFQTACKSAATACSGCGG